MGRQWTDFARLQVSRPRIKTLSHNVISFLWFEFVKVNDTRIMPSSEDKNGVIPYGFKGSPRFTRHYSVTGPIAQPFLAGLNVINIKSSPVRDGRTILSSLTGL